MISAGIAGLVLVVVGISSFQLLNRPETVVKTDNLPGLPDKETKEPEKLPAKEPEKLPADVQVSTVAPVPEPLKAAEKQPLQQEAQKVTPGDQIKQMQQAQMQILRGARRQNQVLLGQATILPTFTCSKCGTSIRLFPMAVDFAGLKSLEDNCRVHLQSSRSKNDQETGKLDQTEFIWIGHVNTMGGPLVDVREIVKANDPRFNNKTEWAHVFMFRADSAPSDPPILSKFVGREFWVESQFLVNQNQKNGFQVKEEEVYFGRTHFPRQKIQDFWAEFCERYTEKIAVKSDPRAGWQEFRQRVEEILADVCDRHGISLQIAWIILDCPTELGLKAIKPEHQEAIDILRIRSYNKR